MSFVVPSFFDLLCISAYCLLPSAFCSSPFQSAFCDKLLVELAIQLAQNPCFS